MVQDEENIVVMTLDGLSSTLFVPDVEKEILIEEEQPQAAFNFEPKKFILGKTNFDDLTKAEKWLLEM